MNKDLAKLARRARKAGWTVERRNNGHLCWRSPAGTVVNSGYTPSDHRALRNIRARLRRAGLVLT